MNGLRPALKSAVMRRLVLARGLVSQQLGRGPHADDGLRYQQMKADNDVAPALYRAGEMWAAINRQFATLIWAGALEKQRDEFFNRRFAAYEPHNRMIYRSLLYMYRRAILPLDVDGFLSREDDPRIGGTDDQEKIAGRLVTLDFLQSVEEMYRVRESWSASGRSGTPRLIIELGAGYGRVAHVARRMLPDCTYVILDLPEALMCSSKWLRQTHGDELVPYEESRAMTRFSRDTLLSRRIWTLGAQQIEHLEDGVADAFINIYSFAEMPARSVANYQQHVDRLTEGIFYSKQRRIEHNVLDRETNDMERLTVPPKWKELFRRDSTLFEEFFETAWATR